MENVIDALKERGFIEGLTNEEEIRQLTRNPVRVYCGFDPTADSLHLGNLVAIMGLAWFQRFGHTPVAIVGGATGMIGDPSGKSTERALLDEKALHFNLKGIQKNLETILNFQQLSTRPLVLNNFDWFKQFSFIDFLREIGKFFRLGPMLAKESVKARLNSEEGMSFTEFSYQVLQGYDFLYLFQHHGVTIQLGGSDQWGNITAGTDLIRKVENKSAYGITFPLLVRSDGQKFGKSEKGAIWLSPDKLSPYEFYQYLIRVEDADVINLMRMLTFMEMAEIKRYEKMMRQPDYIPRTAQKRLAEEITHLVHGKEGLEKAIKVTQGVAPGTQGKLDLDALEQIAADMPSRNLALQDILDRKLIDLLVETGLQPTKGEARRLIRNGGAYLNERQVLEENYTLKTEDIIDSRFVLLSTGKKNKLLIRLG